MKLSFSKYVMNPLEPMRGGYQLKVMKNIFSFLCMLMSMLMIGCSSGSLNENYAPSITHLKPNETLVMALSACHWGCTEGVIKFKDGKAIKGLRSLEITEDEIALLDSYFALGELDEKMRLRDRCSLPIEIGFELKKGFSVVKKTPVKIYPCVFSDEGITPLDLVDHFNDGPNEVPVWRLSSEERAGRFIIED